MIKIIAEDSFEEEVLKADKPVIVDFYADWCMPCKIMSPVLETLDKEQAGKIKIVKLNVDENPEITMKHRVSSIPTLIFFVDGVAKTRVEGAVSKSAVEDKLKKCM